jgi:hypothetical protein
VVTLAGCLKRVTRLIGLGAVGHLMGSKKRQDFYGRAQTAQRWGCRGTLAHQLTGDMKMNEDADKNVHEKLARLENRIYRHISRVSVQEGVAFMIVLYGRTGPQEYQRIFEQYEGVEQ